MEKVIDDAVVQDRRLSLNDMEEALKREMLSVFQLAAELLQHKEIRWPLVEAYYRRYLEKVQKLSQDQIELVFQDELAARAEYEKQKKVMKNADQG